MSTNQATPERGLIRRDEFAAIEQTRKSETSMAGVAAREQAIVQAEYIMAERHKRTWPDVRRCMLDHCSRPKFSEISRYARPVGKELVNGEWIEKKARGFTIRFAETLAQEMGNIKPWSAVTYEDDLLRIVRIGVTDLEKNIPRSREVTFAKATEKRGLKNKKTGVWEPPDGRELISSRINSRNEPVFLVKATEDEMRNKVNSEESKTIRDFIIRFCPRDILEDCEEAIVAALSTEDKKDPLAATKRLLDRFAEFGIMPSELEQYIGSPTKQWGPTERQELIDLGSAIRDGSTTFRDALRIRMSAPAEGEEETQEARDARLRWQMANQSRDAQAAAKARKEEEIERAKRKCGTCGEEGHDTRNCPQKTPALATVAPPVNQTPSGRIPVREVESLDAEDPKGFAPALKCQGKWYMPNSDKSAWKQVPQDMAEAAAQ